MIDFKALEDARVLALNMVEYYGKSDEKQRQNAALEAAGLKPLHADFSFRWDREQRERYQRQADALAAVLAQLAPAEAA